MPHEHPISWKQTVNSVRPAVGNEQIPATQEIKKGKGNTSQHAVVAAPNEMNANGTHSSGWLKPYLKATSSIHRLAPSDAKTEIFTRSLVERQRTAFYVRNLHHLGRAPNSIKCVLSSV